MTSNGVKQRTILIVLPYGFNDRMTNFVEYVVARLLAREGWHIVGRARKEAGEPARHIVYGIDVRRYSSTKRGFFMLLRIFLFERPDIVHVHTLRNNRVGILAAILANIFRVPLAFSEAGLLHDHYLVDDRDDPLGKPIHYERVALRLRDGLRSFFFHYPLTHADAVVFFSKHNLPLAERLGIRAQYVPQILDEHRWDSAGGQTDERIALPSEPYALFVGQMKGRKGGDILLRAIPHVDAKLLPKFVFVSSTGRETDDFSGLIKELGIAERVVFLGRIKSNSILKEVFEHASLVVVPSRYEGFGLVPLDAFDCGKPVVATRVEALTDYLVHGENAYLVEPNDPRALAEGIAAVMRDPSLRERLSAGGRSTIAEFRREELATAWLNFYRSLL